MKKTLYVLEKLYGRSLAQETAAHLAELASARTRAARDRATTLLRELGRERGTRVVLGQTEWGDPVELPLDHLIRAHSIMTGGTGSGKTMAALLIVDLDFFATSRVGTFQELLP